MVWTEIPLDGRTYMYVFARGHMTAAIPRYDIREPIVRPYAGAIFVDAFILMQYNACAHTARMSLTFLYDEGISVMNWQTSYADLNSIGHTWDILSRRIRQRPHHPGNVENRTYRCPGSGIAGHTAKGHQEYATSLPGVCER